MALIIAIVNKSGLVSVSDYEATVYINEYRLAGPIAVTGHRRSDGWQALVKQFAASLELQPQRQPVK